MMGTAGEPSGLKIASRDGASWLSIERRSDDYGYSAWAVEASAQTAHGDRFSGRNADLQLFRLDGFIAALDAFILDRRAPAELEGTYGSFIRFAGDASAVRVEFSVGDQGAFGRHAVTGAFPIEQDQLLGVLAGFRALAQQE